MIERYFSETRKHINTLFILTVFMFTVGALNSLLRSPNIYDIGMMIFGLVGFLALWKYRPIVTGSEITESRFVPLKRFVPQSGRELRSKEYEELDQKDLHEATRGKMRAILAAKGHLTVLDATNLYYYDKVVKQPGVRRRSEGVRKDELKAKLLTHERDEGSKS